MEPNILPVFSVITSVLLIITLPLACFVFWLFMLIDLIKNDHIDKLFWVLIMIFLNLIGALLYYFMVKKAPK
jgi:hypothetical protein